MKKKNILYAAALLLGIGICNEGVFGSNLTIEEGLVPLEHIKYTTNYAPDKIVTKSKRNTVLLFLSILLEAMNNVDFSHKHFNNFYPKINRFLKQPDSEESLTFVSEVQDRYLVGGKNSSLMKFDPTFFDKKIYSKDINSAFRKKLIWPLTSLKLNYEIALNSKTTDDTKVNALLSYILAENQFITPQKFQEAFRANQQERFTEEIGDNYDVLLFKDIRTFLASISNFLNNNITVADFHDNTARSAANLLDKVRLGIGMHHASNCVKCKSGKYCVEFIQTMKFPLRDLFSKNLKKIFNNLSSIVCLPILGSDAQMMQKVCSNIVSHMFWAYSPTLRNDFNIYNCVQKISCKNGYGTGTLVCWDGMPNSLIGRVVLSCAHLYLHTNTWGKDGIMQMITDMFFLGVSYFSNEKRESIFLEKPTKRTMQEFSKTPGFYPFKKATDPATSGNINFGGMNIVYVFLNISRDLAIFILEKPYKSLTGVPISPVSLTYKQLTSPIYYNIGYGSKLLEPIELEQKKATVPYAIFVSRINNEAVYRENPDTSQPGDSGSPIVWRDPTNGKIIIAGVTTGYNPPFLTPPQFNWIVYAINFYADMEQRGDI